MTPERLLTAAASFSVRRPRTVLLAALVALALSLGLAATHLEIRTSNLDLVDPDLPPVRAFTDFAERFGTPNVLVVVLESADAEALGAAVDRVGPLLRQSPGVRGVVDRLPADEETLADLGMSPHLLSDDGQLAFILVQPDDPHSSAVTIAPFVEGVRDTLAGAHLDATGVHAGLTGMPQYALDDRDVIQRDISRLSGVAAILVLLVFVAAFGSAWRPLLAMVALLVSVGIVLGLVSIWPGHLTLLSAFFASILFGLGIDFAVHLLGHVEELVAAGRTERDALPEAVRHLGRGLTTAALTTSAVFYAMMFSGFRGFAELGMVAGSGLLVCLLGMVTVLPALLVVFHPRAASERVRDRRHVARLLHALQHPVLAAVVGLAALACFAVPAPRFDTDYLDLEPAGSEAVRLEREMVRRSDLSPNFAAFTTASRDEALALSERLLREDTVGEVASIADLDALADPASGGEVPFRKAFESADGRFAVYAYPKGDIWHPEEQDRFIDAMQAIDPSVTGMPVLGRFMVLRSQHALLVTAWIGAALLLLCVWLDFRSVPLTVVATLPTWLAVVSMHALMRLCEVDYNPLDVMALPVVIGIAVDDGVHVVHRWLAEGGDVQRTLAGTGRSVVLTSLTTMAAFGALAFTTHRGLASFALALTLGVGSALVLSLLVLPGLLVRLGPWLLATEAARRRRRPSPWEAIS